MTQKLLTVNEVAEVMDLKPARIYELSREGKLPFLVRIGDRQYRYNAQGLANWIQVGGNRASGNVEASQDEK